MILHVLPEVYNGISNVRTGNVQRGSWYDCARVDDVKHKSLVVTLNVLVLKFYVIVAHFK